MWIRENGRAVKDRSTDNLASQIPSSGGPDGCEIYAASGGGYVLKTDGGIKKRYYPGERGWIGKYAGWQFDDACAAAEELANSRVLAGNTMREVLFDGKWHPCKIIRRWWHNYYSAYVYDIEIVEDFVSDQDNDVTIKKGAIFYGYPTDMIRRI